MLFTPFLLTRSEKDRLSRISYKVFLVAIFSLFFLYFSLVFSLFFFSGFLCFILILLSFFPKTQKTKKHPAHNLMQWVFSIFYGALRLRAYVLLCLTSYLAARVLKLIKLRLKVLFQTFTERPPGLIKLLLTDLLTDL